MLFFVDDTVKMIYTADKINTATFISEISLLNIHNLVTNIS